MNLIKKKAFIGGGSITYPELPPPGGGSDAYTIARLPGTTSFVIVGPRYPLGLVVPDFTRAGVQSGIPAIPATRYTPATRDTAGINAALAQAQAFVNNNPASRAAVQLEDGEYTYTGTLQSLNVPGIEIIGGDNTRITFTGPFNRAAILLGGTLSTQEIFLRANTAENETVIPVNAATLVNHAAKFAPGLWGRLRIDQPASVNGKFRLWTRADKTWFSKLVRFTAQDLVNATLTLNESLRYPLETTRNCKFRQVNGVNNVGVRNLTIRFAGDSSAAGVRFEYADNFWLDNVFVENPQNYSVDYAATAHGTVRQLRANQPRLRGGGQGYGGMFDTTDTIWTGCDLTGARHAPIAQAFTEGIVFHDCIFRRSDAHFPHLLGGYGLIDNCTIEKAGSFKPYLLELGPEPDNAQHVPTTGYNVVWNSDFWNSGGQFEGRGIRLGSNNNGTLLAFNRMKLPTWHDAQRIPGMMIYSETPGGVEVWGNKFAFNLAESLRPGAVVFADFLPGIQEEYLEGTTLYRAIQTGLAGSHGYPSLSNEVNRNPSIPATPNNSVVHFRDNKIIGLTADNIWRGVSGAGPATNEGTIIEPTWNPNETRPAAPVGLESLLAAQIANA